MIEILSVDSDGRIGAGCANARCTLEWFLNAVRGAEKNLKIQRGIIGGSKAYATLRADLKRGCLLPPIVLAAKNLNLDPAVMTALRTGNAGQVNAAARTAIGTRLTQLGVDDIYIIDGLQRTNAVMQVLEDLDPNQRAAYLARHLRLEIWLDIPFNAIAYRMLILNAGQKPMSIKHQIEVLSMKLEEELKVIAGIDIFTSLQGRRRTKGGQFQLAKLAQAFQAWLQGQPNLDLRNTVMEQMLAETAIETLGQSLEGAGAAAQDAFKKFVEWLVFVDRKTSEAQLEFFGNETVLLGLAAAVGTAERNATLKARAWRCLEAIKQKYADQPDQDHLAITSFETLRKGIDPSKVNVGQATRDLVFATFQEHFVADGIKSMDECWRFAAGRA